MADARLEVVQAFLDGLGLLRADVTLDAAQHIGRVVDAVAGDLLEQVHHGLAVAPGVHEQGIEPGFVGGHTQPEQVPVDALQPGHDLTDGLGARRGFHLRQFLHAEAVGQGMRMRADAAHALEQVQVLVPVAALGGLLDAAVGIAQAHVRGGHDLAIHGELEVPRLLEGGMLRADGDDELVIAHASGLGDAIRSAARGGHGLLQGEVRPHRVHPFRPVIGDEQAVVAVRALDLEAEHLVQLALEEGRRRDDVLDGRHTGLALARQVDAQGGDGGFFGEVVERLHAVGLGAEVQAGDGGEIAAVAHRAAPAPRRAGRPR